MNALSRRLLALTAIVFSHHALAAAAEMYFAPNDTYAVASGSLNTRQETEAVMGAKVQLGYTLSSVIGVEGGVSQTLTSKLSSPPSGGNAELSTSLYHLAGVANFSGTTLFRAPIWLQIKAGAGWVSTTTEVKAGNYKYNSDDDGVGLYLSGGLIWGYQPNLGLRFEVENYGGKVTTYSIGSLIKF